jgi:hypothetical protein
MVAHESGLSHPMTALGRWARRIVSEDSVHSMTSLPAAVHPFPESKNLTVVLVAETTGAQKKNCALPEPIVVRLRPHDRKPIEERHDPAGEIRKSIDLPIPTAVSCLSHCPAPQGLPKEIKRHAILLRHIESG